MQKKLTPVTGSLALLCSLLMSGAADTIHAKQSDTLHHASTTDSNSSPFEGANPEPDLNADSGELSGNRKKLPAGERFMVAIGKASYYGKGFQGKKTAAGRRFNTMDFTAAHRSLPFGTIVRVTNLNNGKQVFVTINDRGPFVKSRIIDLSTAAAQQLGIVSSGIGKVRIEAWN